MAFSAKFSLGMWLHATMLRGKVLRRRMLPQIFGGVKLSESWDRTMFQNVSIDKLKSRCPRIIQTTDFDGSWMVCSRQEILFM